MCSFVHGWGKRVTRLPSPKLSGILTKRTLLGERFLTTRMCALPWFLTSMSVHMLRQRLLGRERLMADWAFRVLVCQMLEILTCSKLDLCLTQGMRCHMSLELLSLSEARGF